MRIANRIAVVDRQLESTGKSLLKLKNQKIGLMQDLLTGKVPVNVTEPTPEPVDA